jgi:glycosyltransferase involved in cell wall biosynthesis
VKATDKVVFHANEWQTGFAALMIEKLVPEIATMFTTHATCIGRSIAGNNKPLYDYLFAYNGDQMAVELNMQSKHSIEKQTAKYVDCFTTVSDITANECKELLDKSVDVVLPNGFDNAFVPKGAAFTSKRKAARKRLLAIANALTGCDFDDDTLVISTSGRYEFRSKGLDVFIEAMNRLRFDDRLHRNVVAFIEVPGWTIGPREDLQERLASGNKFDTALRDPRYTHWLHNAGQDSVLGMMNYLDMHNRKEDKVKVIFVPSYLIGDDGIVNIPYYNMVLGNDLCVYPSYYEPWGYTPLEAVAFKVPCITTDLAGFGLWANSIKGGYSEIGDGVKVVHRTDYNYSEVADAIKDTVVEFSSFSADEVKASRTNAERISKKALWDKFMTYYIDAYDFALRKCDERNSVK